jgi:L-fuculose-phosphate aldolase
MLLSQFQAVGRNLFIRGLVSSHSGNLSIRMGDRMVITRRGSNLGSLGENDLIETGIFKNDRSTPLASVELPVHRTIYRETQAKAIVHAHTTHAIALSFNEKCITSDQLEGLSGLSPVPVLGWDVEVKPGGLADTIAESLKTHRIVIIRGHGSFATGQLLEEALDSTSSLEESCEVLCLLKSIQMKPAASI